MSRLCSVLFCSLILTVVLSAAEAPVPAGDIAKIEAAVPAKATVQPAKPRKLLVVNTCKGFYHDSIPYVAKAIEIMGQKTGAYTATVTQDSALFQPDKLKEFDAVCFNNTTGTLFDDAALKESLLSFVRGGKGVVGIHAATDCFYEWTEYGQMMGGYFNGHPWNEDVGVKIDEPKHPLNAAFNGQGFVVADEIYQFKAPYSRDMLRVILSLDPNKTNMNKGGMNRPDGDYAVSWLRSFGEGRSFYCSLGHRKEILWNKPVLQHYLDGIQFALGDLKADASPLPLSPRAADACMGFYEGAFTGSDGKTVKGEARVIAEGGGRYRAVLLPAETAGGLATRFEVSSGGGDIGTPIDVRKTNAVDGPKGVKFEYYEGDWDKLPDFGTLKAAKTGECDYFDIKDKSRDDNFGFRFTGFVVVPADGRYEFATNSDDGSRLYIGDKMVVDNDGLHGEQTMTGTIELKKGAHPITVTFFEKGGGEALRVGGGRVVEKTDDGLALEGEIDGVKWKGLLKGDVLQGTADGGRSFKLTYVERTSPTLGAKPPAGAKVLLTCEPGKEPSLAAWTNTAWIPMPDGSMQAGKGDNKTKEGFGDAQYHIEFMCPFVPTGRGQGRGNSGVYLQDRYEVQVLDSFGLVSQDNDCGGIYKIAVPKVNVCLPPLRWQTYDIDFRAARFDANGAVTAKPRITVKHNGVVIHDNIEIPDVTGGAAGKEHVAKAPLRFQDHGNPVRFRNVWIVEGK